MDVAKQLITLKKKKSYLGEFCASVVCELLECCPVEVCRDPLLLDALELGVGWEQCSTDHLHILLHASKLYSKVHIDTMLLVAAHTP